MRQIQADRVNASSLVVWIVCLLISLRLHDALHVARPAKLTCDERARRRRQSLGDDGLLNLFSHQLNVYQYFCTSEQFRSVHTDRIPANNSQLTDNILNNLAYLLKLTFHIGTWIHNADL